MTIKRLLPVTAKNLENNIPFYLLYGLYHHSDAVYTIRSIKESFLPFKRQYIFDRLWNYVDELANEYISSENIMGMIYKGWLHCKGKDFDKSFFNNTDKKFKLMCFRYQIQKTNLLKSIVAGADEYDWYPTTYQKFKEKLIGYNIELFVKVFAVTSPMNHLASNTVLALEAYDCLEQEKSIADLECFGTIKNMLLEIRMGTFDDHIVTTRRKVWNFMNGLNGAKHSVAVDSNLLLACGLGKLYINDEGEEYIKCRKLEYDLIEQYFLSLSKISGFEARQISSMTWAGVRRLEGKYKISDISEILDRALTRLRSTA